MFDNAATALPDGDRVLDEPSWLADWSPDVELALLVGDATARLETVLATRPCAATMQALELLAQQPLDAGQRVLFAQAWQRQADAAAGMATAALADAATPAPTAGEFEAEVLTAECAAALRLSPDAARDRVAFARRMREVLPATLERWCAGAASAAHARILEDATVGLPSVLASRVDDTVAGRAGVSHTWFRRLVRREVARLTPDDADRVAARRDAHAFLDPTAGGLTVLGVPMAPVQAIAAMQALNARADAARSPQDTRSHGERQADVLLDLLLGAPRNGQGEIRRRYRTEVQVGISLPALLGLRDDPGYLVGYGPIPASDIRELIGTDGTVLRRLVIDPVDGRLIDYGHTRYRPDDRLTRVVQAKERTCRFPHCTRPAARCDIDHNEPYDTGGDTSERNCHLLCRTHHRLKTFHHYRYTIDPDTGTVTWTTPHGHTHHTPPGSYPEFLDSG